MRATQGFIVNWELESQILSRALHRSVLDPHNTLSSALSLGSTANLVEECSVLVTLPVLAPSRFAADLDENVLEKWAAKRYRRIQCAPLAHRGVMDEVYPPTAAAAAFPGASAAAAAAPSASAAASAAGAAAGASSKEPLHRLVALVVDSGYSFTHILPVYRGSIITTAARRLNIGGKLLTNYLKELVSFRAWNMMDETWIINDVKEKCCYVSTDFEREIQAAKSVHSLARASARGGERRGEGEEDAASALISLLTVFRSCAVLCTLSVHCFSLHSLALQEIAQSGREDSARLRAAQRQHGARRIRAGIGR